MKREAKLILREDLLGNVTVDVEFSPGMDFGSPAHVRALQLYDLGNFISSGVLTAKHMELFNTVHQQKSLNEKATANGEKHYRQNHPEI